MHFPAIHWKAVEGAARWAVGWLSVHTGIPALIVAAIVVVVGVRLLKKFGRVMVEIALVAAVLCAATRFGWLHW